MAISAVIFDFDGLLLDTETLNLRVNQTIVGRYGLTFPPEVRARIQGRPALASAEIVVAALDLPLSPADYVAERARLVPQLVNQVVPLPGAVRLSRHLADRGIPRAIATGSTYRSFQMKAAPHRHWLEAAFACVVCGDDPELARPKPAPDIFVLAARRLGVAPEQCLVFEDAISGVRGAKAAGMAVVAVPDASLDPASYAEADSILESLDAFVPEQWGLPGYPESEGTGHIERSRQQSPSRGPSMP